MTLIRLGLVAIALLVAIQPIPAQNIREKLRMAAAFEQGGDLRNAARLYQEVYDAAPDNSIAFQGTVRSLMLLNQYQPAYDIAARQATRLPDVDALLTAARLGARLNKLPEADAWWKKAVEAGGDAEDIHLLIAQDQMQASLHSRAIASYLAARERGGDPQVYAHELASVYIAAGDVENGTRELITLFRSGGQSNLVRGLLSALMASPEQRITVAGIIGALPDDPVANLSLKQWVARENNDWPAALRIAQKIDKARGTRGQETLLLADAARMDGKLDIALDAYASVMENSSVPDGMALSATYGYARTLEQRLRTNRSAMNADEARRIIERYSDIVSRYPENPMSSDALLNIARLEDEVLHDVPSATTHLQRLTNSYKGTSAAATGTLLLADLYMAAGNTALADEILAILASSARAQMEEQRDLARLRRADLLFYRNAWDSAKSAYQALAANPTSVAANDAIEKMVLLATIADDSAAVKLVAQAEWLAIQRKPLEAAEMFVKASQATSDAEVKDHGKVSAARNFILAGRDAEASKLLAEVIERAPDAINGDRALLLDADIKEKNKDGQGAISSLTALLVQYPRSIHVPAARDRIRRLRGDI